MPAMTTAENFVTVGSISGPVINGYTFSVSIAMDGLHSSGGDDEAIVRGWNENTDTWDTLDSANPDNGVTFTRDLTLLSEDYSLIEFYFYNDDGCCYSDPINYPCYISYSIEY